jgi:hypothetical protein
MANGILFILQNPEYGKCLGNNAHAFAMDHYNYHSYVSKVNRIYTELHASKELESTVQV